MSLTTDGVWAANVWASTVWGDCVWSEPHCVITVTATAKGGYVPPTYRKYKLRKKDESVLEEIQALLEVVEEVSDPVIESFQEQVLEQQIEEIKQHFDFAAASKQIADRNQQMQVVKVELKNLTRSVNEYAKVRADKKEDESRRRLLLLS